MKIEDLDRTLPNGFHDSCLRQVTVDYEAQTASLTLDIWIGEADAPLSKERERLRTARLELLGLEYFIVEPPDPRYKYRDAGSVTVDLCDSDPAIATSRPLALGGFGGRFFVTEWNAFIHLAEPKRSHPIFTGSICSGCPRPPACAWVRRPWSRSRGFGTPASSSPGFSPG